jgi:hypothetical protein
MTIQWVSLMGYFAAILVGCTFYMKTTIPLRIFAIASNFCFITYAVFHHPVLYPVLILHTFLLPLNITRLVQLKKLIKEAKSEVSKDKSFDWLIPYMKKEVFKRGSVLFQRGEPNSKLYLIQQGRVILPEINRIVGPGEMIGEIGVLSPHKLATTTALCEDDLHVLTIHETQVLALYYQNPNFGLYLLQILMKRFIDTQEELKEF